MLIKDRDPQRPSAVWSIQGGVGQIPSTLIDIFFRSIHFHQPCNHSQGHVFYYSELCVWSSCWRGRTLPFTHPHFIPVGLLVFWLREEKKKWSHQTRPSPRSQVRCKGDQPILLQLLQVKLFIPLFITSFSSIQLNVRLPWYKLDWGGLLLALAWELAVRKSRLSCVLMKGSCWSGEHEGLF